MPVRRGHLAPAHTYIETVIRKFDGYPGRNFIIGNALSDDIPIIYCSSSFCSLTGYDRHELMQRSARCEFLYGPETDITVLAILGEALQAGDERHFETNYYKKDGEQFLCSVIIAPIRNDEGNIILYIVNHEEIQTQSPLSRNNILGTEQKSPQRKISTILRHSFRRKKSVQNNKKNDKVYDEETGEDSSKTISPIHNSSQLIQNPRPEDTQTGSMTRKISSPIPPQETITELSECLSTRKCSIASSNLTDVRLNEHHYLLSSEEEHDYTGHRHNTFNSGTDFLCNTSLDQTPANANMKNNVRAIQTPTLVLAGATKKVAQVMSLGSDVMPEYKVESPKIHPWTILHYSPFKAIWDWIVLFLVMYTAIVTPYMAAFVLTRNPKQHTPHNHEDHSSSISIVDDPLVIIDYIVDVMFIIDIFINFRTTFVDANDEVVSDPCRVAVNYIKGWFTVDLLAAIPFELLIMIGNTDQTTTLIGLLKTARLLRLVRVARKLDRYSEYGTALLMLLMFGFALVAHWLACVWYAIGNFERPDDIKQLSWLTQLGVSTGTPYNNSDPESGPRLDTKYLTALYFTLSSLTSVGFGNVSANTNGEKIFTILIMFLGALMHAVIFGNVTAIIQRLYSGMAHYHTTMRKVREFIRFYQIPAPLRQRLEDYAQYDYSYTNGIDMNEVLRNFPEGLQADICLHLNRNLLFSNPAFRSSTPGCLRSLSLKLSTTHCPPGDYIIHHGDEISSLYWIGRGTVEIVQSDAIIAILGKSDSFGEHFGFRNSKKCGKARASVRALTYCDLHSISRVNLLYIMNAYPEFRRTFTEEMQITFDLRELDDEEKDPYSSHQSIPAQGRSRSWTERSSSLSPNIKQPFLKEGNQDIFSKTESKPANHHQPSRLNDSLEKNYSKTINEEIDTTLFSLLPHGEHNENFNSFSNNQSKANANFDSHSSTVNSTTKSICCCSNWKKDIEELRVDLTTMETSMKDDIKVIIELLRSKHYFVTDFEMNTPKTTGVTNLTSDTSV